MTGRNHVCFAVAALAMLGVWMPASAVAAKVAPPLPPPSGTVIYVSTPGELQTAISRNLASNTTIMINAGVYDMSSVTAARWIQGPMQNIAFRGATGNRDDVVLVGTGMYGSGAADYIFQFTNNIDGILVADMTLKNVYHHLVHIMSGCHAPHFYNVRLIDCRTQFLKIQTIDDGIVEYCQFEFTDRGPDDYMHGIDCLTSDNWIIRDNTFLRMRGPSLSGGAILMWHGCQNTLVERNEFIECDFGVAFGNPGGDDPDHVNGIIRNNFFYRGPDATTGDVAITLNRAQNARVYNNTAVQHDLYYWATIDGRYPTTTALIYNNLLDNPINPRDGATLTMVGNLTNAGDHPEWFGDFDNGDLHLTELATSAIDQAQTLPDPNDVVDDYDCDSRPAGAAKDVGADEYVSAVPELISSEPPADGTLPKTQNNVIKLVFSNAITLPGGDPLVIVQMGGGPDVSSAFSYQIDPNDPSGATLKAVEQGAQLTNLTWYNITPAAGLAVQAFSLDVCTLTGDANNSSRVTAADYSEVKAHMSEYTDNRYDLNGSGRITTADYSVVKSNISHRTPTKP